jgi:N,N'-diacetyllegionaminate synthase
MIQAAFVAGADAIKFQHHLPDEEMLPSVPSSSNMAEPLYEFLKRNALTISQHKELSDFAKGVGIRYLCTPFSWQAALELETVVDPPAYKIGSGEFTDSPTLRRIATFGKPMILSTGMSTVDEIDWVYELMCSLNVPFALMNCTSAYPPQACDISLGFLPEMARRYPAAWLGHSDHMPGIATALGAVALGARILEKHVTMDKQLAGPDADVSITFNDLANLVEGAEEIADAMSSEKFVRPSEHEIRLWARRSLVYTAHFYAGHMIAETDIWGKRPGTGVPSSSLEQYVGRRLVRDVKANTLLSDDDFT